MVFSTKSTVPHDIPTKIKRPRSDSELVMPHAKRTKRALSHDDNTDTHISSVDSSGQDSGSQKSDSMPHMSTIWRSCGRGNLASASISSGSTAVPSDDAASSLDLGPTEEDAVMMQSLINERYRPAASPLEKIFASEFLRVQTSILEPLVTQDRLITPYYRQGMLRAYLISDCDVRPDAFSDEESALTMIMGNSHRHLTTPFVNRTLEKAYRNLFYSRNRFAFVDPRAALWFFKSIGENIKSIRSVMFTMYGGLERYRRNDTISESIEELWYSVVCWLQYRHELDNLTIVFRDMPTRRDLSWYVKNCDFHMIEDAMMFRKKIMHKLNKFRGITNVRLTDPSNVFIMQHELCDLQLAMQQPKEKGELIEDKRMTPLLDTLRSSNIRSNLAANAMTESDEFEDLFDYNRGEDQSVETSQESTPSSKVIDSHETDSTTRVEVFNANTNSFDEVSTISYDDPEASGDSIPTLPSASLTLFKNEIRSLQRKEEKLSQMKEKVPKEVTHKVLAPVIIHNMANDSEAQSKYNVLPPPIVGLHPPHPERDQQLKVPYLHKEFKSAMLENVAHVTGPAALEAGAPQISMSELLQPATITDESRSASHSETTSRRSTLSSEIPTQSFYSNPISNPNNLHNLHTSSATATGAGLQSSTSTTDGTALQDPRDASRRRQQGYYGKKRHTLSAITIWNMADDDPELEGMLFDWER